MSWRYGPINDWGMDPVDMEQESLALKDCEPMQRLMSAIYDDILKMSCTKSKKNIKQR